MNKLQKILLGFVGMIAMSFMLMAVTKPGTLLAGMAATQFNVQYTSVSNEVYGPLTITTNPAAYSNVSGVATLYTLLTTNLPTNNVALCPYNDKTVLLLIKNNAAAATGAIWVTASSTPPSNGIGTNGWLILGAGGSLTFPNSTVPIAPAQIFGISTSAAAWQIPVSVEQWTTVAP